MKPAERVRRGGKVQRSPGRKTPREAALRPTFPEAPNFNPPDLILIDGGKGQLNAACAELAKLGLEKLPIIGLAKEFEEIYRPGESVPLRLGWIIRR
jgi:excinuclease UvrABC nuclease subunit